MKRILLHVAFWTVYTMQDTLLQFVWVGPALKKIPENTQFWMALQAALVTMIPKLLIVYFLLYVVIRHIVHDNYRMLWIVLEITVAIVLTILLYRALFAWLINPVIYPMLKRGPFFSLFNILLAILDLGFICGITITVKLLRIQLAGKEREKKLLKGKMEAELKFLRHQTNPHFLFNTLNNIYALARKKSDNTAEVVLRLSKLLRFILYESKNELITMVEELKILDDYLELEKVRYDQRLTINFEKEIDDYSAKIAPLLLLPFVENAFKHGASESRFDALIDIDVKLHQGHLTFTIENTKESSDSEQIVDNIGLGNVRRQLELMYAAYDLEVQNKESSFAVHLYINLNSYAKV